MMRNRLVPHPVYLNIEEVPLFSLSEDQGSPSIQFTWISRKSLYSVHLKIKEVPLFSLSEYRGSPLYSVYLDIEEVPLFSSSEYRGSPSIQFI